MSRLKRFSHNDQIQWRRSRVAEYCIKSIPITEQSRILAVSEKTIKRDISVLSDMARENLAFHISELLPWEFEKSLQTFEYIKRLGFELYEKSGGGGDDRTKVSILRLIAEAEAAKFKLLQEGPNVLAIQNIERRLSTMEQQREAELQQKYGVQQQIIR
jgi:hypothetical protein